MIDKPRDTTGGCVDDHVLVEGHEIVALEGMSGHGIIEKGRERERSTM
jgi:hypothetical protein